MAVFQRVPGSARRYVNIETGVEYSRRQRDAILGRKPSKYARSNKQKTKLYYQLLDSYIEKKIQTGEFKKGERGLKKKARESDEMKQIVKDLKSKDPFKKLAALKKTTRRDNVPDTIPVGETPSVYSEAA